MIKLKGITKTYETTANEVKVFENFDFCLNEKEITCILGKSGCGKTTLLNVLAGTIDYEGKIEGFDGKVSYIFQESRLLPNLTVLQNLKYAVKDASEEKINQMLSLAEIEDKSNVFSGQLSGGQAQRVSIVRAFLKESELLLMDEPFSSLDTALKIRLTKAFVDLWQRDKRGVLFVTHDLEEAFMLAHRIVVLDEGKILYDVKVSGDIPREYGMDSEQKRGLLHRLLSIS